MKKIKNNQLGFGVIEIILIVVIVGLLGGLGWYVWKQKASTSNTNNTVPAKSESTATNNTDTTKNIKTTIDDTSTWKEVKNNEYNFSYKYPDESDWVSATSNVATNNQTYTEGSRAGAYAKYSSCGRNCGLAFNLSVYTKGSTADVGVNYVEDIQMKDNTYYKLTTKTTITQDGVSGTKWVYTPSDDKTSKIIYYYFAVNKYAYFFEINSNGAKTDKVDITKLGEKIFSTFKFLNS